MPQGVAGFFILSKAFAFRPQFSREKVGSIRLNLPNLKLQRRNISY